MNNSTKWKVLFRRFKDNTLKILFLENLKKTQNDEESMKSILRRIDVNTKNSMNSIHRWVEGVRKIMFIQSEN